MPSFVFLLQRSLSISKQEWRQASCQRAFAPLDVQSIVKGIWQTSGPKLADRDYLELSLQQDGSPENTPVVHSVQGQQKAFLGVFDFSFIANDRVKVMLREEECSRQLGIPRRPTRQIGLLRPWRPMRVSLNGRYAGSSGQYYLLKEYHLVLCDGLMPERVDQARTVDLQADLL